LDNRRILKRNAGGDPPNTVPISFDQVKQFYNFPANRADGQAIAIFSEGGYLPSDIKATLGIAPAITDITVDASNGNFADAETTQDICISAAVAPGAAIGVYFTTYSQQGWVDLITRVIHPNAGDPVCSVLSSSFYVSNGDDAATLSNEGISTSWLTAVTQAFQDAAIQGVTICIASGDTGTQSKVGDGKAHVQYPASDPWVLSCGGTTIGNINGSSFDEWVWNDSTGATGGGVSDFFNSRPGYQVGVGVPKSLNDNHVGRGVPDVAANSSPFSGYPITVGGAPGIGDGTSASAPLWAGLIAVLNAAIGASVGFMNPAIYRLGSSYFQDIVGSPGPADNGFAGVAGYPAGAGWDACTGWGSIDGVKLLAGLKGLGGGLSTSVKVAITFPPNFNTFLAGRPIEIRGNGTWTPAGPSPVQAMQLSAFESRWDGVSFGRWVHVADFPLDLTPDGADTVRWKHMVTPFDGMARYMLTAYAFNSSARPIGSSDPLFLKSVEG
jgi:kumamolisin